jgi:DNA polymerase III delta subunit
MIYLFYGQDIEQARRKGNGVVESLLKKRPDASLFRLDSDSWQEAAFDEYVGGQGLFVQKYIVILDQLFEKKEIKEYVVERLKLLKASDNIFIVLENSLDKATLAKFEKNAEKVQAFGEGKEGLAKGKKPADFNMFAITDALGARNQKRLWTIYQKALRHGVVSEELHGILFWQVKSMLLAAESKDVVESGLNPFVYSKAKNYAKNFTLPELKNISSQLVTMYHQAHRGEVDFDIALEKFFLSI